MTFGEAPSRARKRVKKGSILVSTVRPNLNAVAILEEETPNVSVASTGFCILDCKENVDERFVFDFCKSQSFIDEMVAQATGASYPAVSDKIVRSALVPAYTYEEQCEISEVFDTVFDIIEKRKEELQNFDDLIKARFIEMFGDRWSNSMKWPSKPLSKVAEFNNGKPHEQVVDENGNYVLVTSRCIASDGMDVRKTNEQLFPLISNDICMVMSDVPNGKALAKCMLISEEGKYSLNQRICCFRKYDYNPIFFYYLLNRHEYFLSFNDGDSQTNLRKGDLLACPMILPPLKMQDEFADFVKQVDKSKAVVQKSLDETQVLFDSLMQKYFG